MTGKADFTDEEWKQVLEGPTSAGMIVVIAQKGGALRETVAMAKAYTEARQQHGESELLDAIVSAKPEMDKTRERSPEELKAHNLENLSEAVAVLESKATPEELAEYRRFIVTLAGKVAERVKGVSDAERAAISEIAATLGTDAPAA